ncbi:unnamed protein product, partial [Allacma fusca]
QREKMQLSSDIQKPLTPIVEENSQNLDKTKKEDSGIYELYKDEFITDCYVLLMFNVFLLYFQQVGLE